MASPADDIRSSAIMNLENVSLVLGGMTIIDNVSLTIGRGEFVCVIGPSGCGKTSLLRLAAGLFEPEKGHVSYDGSRLQGPRKDIAVVFQDYGRALLGWRSVAGNVALALEAIKYPRENRKARIDELLSLVGLEGRGDQFPSQLSGGMQQRLQIARCLAQEPSVLLMDEPFGALDAMTRQSLQDEVLRLKEQTGLTIFFITHDLEEAIYLGDRVIGLLPRPGRLGIETSVELPSPRDQVSTPEHAEFLRLRRELFEFIKAAEHG